MIGKISIGKSFRGCLQYCLNDKISKQKDEVIFKDRATVLWFNQCFGSVKELVQQFNEVRQLNPVLSKPVLHITLSLVPGEKLSHDKLMSVAQDCAAELGFDNNQYLAVLHHDTRHQHLHIVANRIGFDKRTVSDSNNFKRMANYCRKMEIKYGLQQVLNPRRFLSKEERHLPRTDQRKEHLKSVIKLTLQEAGNFTEFRQKMEAHGYQVVKGRGISFIDSKKVKFKGSDVGFPLMKIEKMLSGKLSQKSKEHLASKHEKTPHLKVEKIEKLIPAFDKAKNKNVITEYLLKSEKLSENINPGLLKKKRKRKRNKPSL